MVGSSGPEYVNSDLSMRQLVQAMNEKAPTPVARLASRAYNESTPERRLRNAYYVFELWARLWAAVAASHYRQSSQRSRAMDELLGSLANPSSGHVAGFLKGYAALHPEDSLATALERRGGEHSTRLVRHLSQMDALAGKVAARERPSLRMMLDSLVTFRNKVLAHAGDLPWKFCDTYAEPVLAGVLEQIVEATNSLGGRFLYVEEIQDAGPAGRLASLFDLTGAQAFRLPEKLGEPVLGDGFQCGWVYHQMEDGGRVVRCHPWLLWQDDFILCVNGASRTQVEYLNYFTGGSVRTADSLYALKQALAPSDDTQVLLPGGFSEVAVPQGKLFGPYVIEGEIGRGGMGTVYAARQISLGLPVALKVLRTDDGLAEGEDGVLARFYREIDILKRMSSHPNIVSILDRGMEKGCHYFVMERIEGCSLAELYGILHTLPESLKKRLRGSHLRRAIELARERRQHVISRRGASKDAVRDHTGPDPGDPYSPSYVEHSLSECDSEGEPLWEILLERFAEMAEAASFLHDHGILHRDIKPSNILLTLDGSRAILTDFGIARVETATVCTSTGTFLGTLRYASREQVAGLKEDINYRADLYSLGATIYELLSLSPLYGENEDTARQLSESALRKLILDESPTPVLERNPSLRPDVGIILEKLLQKRPELRFYASAADLGEDLRSVLSQRPIRARAYTPQEREAHALYDSLVEQANTWGRQLNPHFLWDEELVSSAERLSLRDRFRFTEHEEKFLRASEDALAEERRRVLLRRKRRRMAIASIVAGIITTLSVLTGWSLRERRKARHFAHIAQANTVRANRLLSAALIQKGRLWDRAGELDRALASYQEAFSRGDTPGAWVGLTQTLQDFAPEVAVLRGHRIDVWHVAFSPAGDLLASASSDGTIRLWDPASGLLRRVLRGHEAKVRIVAFSPDGLLLASASLDRTVRIWEVATGVEQQLLGPFAWDVRSVAFHPSGDRLAVGCRDGLVTQWRLGDKPVMLEPIFQLDGSAASLSYSPDGQRLAAGSWSNAPHRVGGDVCIFDTETGAEQWRGEEHLDYVDSVAFSPDGKMVASGSRDGRIKVWDVTSGQSLRTIEGHASYVMSVAYSPDGRLLASASRDRTVRLWSVATGALLAVLRGHQDWVVSVAFQPGGLLLASGSWDKTVRLRKLPTHWARRVIRCHTSDVNAVAFSPDGRWLASGSKDLTIGVWDLARDQRVGALTGHKKSILTVAVSPDGRTIASGSKDHTTMLWTLSHSLSDGRSPLATPHKVESRTDFVRAVAFHPRGHILAAGGYDTLTTLWTQGSPWKPRPTLKFHRERVHDVAFSPDGKLLATVASDNRMAVWRVDNSALQYHVDEAHRDSILSVAFSPDGKRIATGSKDDSIRIWELGSKRPSLELHGQLRGIWTLAYSPDGKMLASGGGDGTVHLWDSQSGSTIDVLQGHTDDVMRVAFRPDGRMLASASEDGTIRLWELSSPADTAKIKKRLALLTRLGVPETVDANEAPTFRDPIFLESERLFYAERGLIPWLPNGGRGYVLGYRRSLEILRRGLTNHQD